MNSKQAKHIRTIVVKQLKTNHPGWKMGRKQENNSYIYYLQSYIISLYFNPEPDKIQNQSDSANQED